MTEDQKRALPPDWRPHLNVVRDRISLRCVGEHFPMVAFLYEDGDDRDAVVVTDKARNGQSFAEADEQARAELLKRAQSRRPS